jgi:hypothetical protein
MGGYVPDVKLPYENLLLHNILTTTPILISLCTDVYINMFNMCPHYYFKYGLTCVTTIAEHPYQTATVRSCDYMCVHTQNHVT